jgi:PII-like signaling protein
MDRKLIAATKLTIAVGGDERRGHHPLYEEVLAILRHEAIAGATVTRGVMSFGMRGTIHTTMNEVTMENLPIIIEAVDEQSRIEGAAALVAELLGEHGLVEIQPTLVLCRTAAPPEGNRE